MRLSSSNCLLRRPYRSLMRAVVDVIFDCIEAHVVLPSELWGISPRRYQLIVLGREQGAVEESPSEQLDARSVAGEPNDSLAFGHGSRHELSRTGADSGSGALRPINLNQEPSTSGSLE